MRFILLHFCSLIFFFPFSHGDPEYVKYSRALTMPSSVPQAEYRGRALSQDLSESAMKTTEEFKYKAFISYSNAADEKVPSGLRPDARSRPANRNRTRHAEPMRTE